MFLKCLEFVRDNDLKKKILAKRVKKFLYSNDAGSVTKNELIHMHVAYILCTCKESQFQGIYYLNDCFLTPILFFFFLLYNFLQISSENRIWFRIFLMLSMLYNLNKAYIPFIE